MTSVGFWEIPKIGRKVIEIQKGVIYRETFKVSPFKKLIDKLFELGQKYRDENNDGIQWLVNLTMNSLYGEYNRRDIEEIYECKSEHWMMTEYDEQILDNQKLSYGNYIVKLKIMLDCNMK